MAEQCQRVDREVTTPTEFPIIDWYKAIAPQAESVIIISKDLSFFIK